MLNIKAGLYMAPLYTAVVHDIRELSKDGVLSKIYAENFVFISWLKNGYL